MILRQPIALFPYRLVWTYLQSLVLSVVKGKGHSGVVVRCVCARTLLDRDGIDSNSEMGGTNVFRLQNTLSVNSDLAMPFDRLKVWLEEDVEVSVVPVFLRSLLFHLLIGNAR